MGGSTSIAALIVEPISNTGGDVTPSMEYLKNLRQICDECNILLIFDEIITGFGRTGSLFAAHTFEVVPDILCCGKGMSSGYAPLAAAVISHLVEQLNAKLRSLGVVGDIRGKGLMIGVELVKDPGTREPFPADLKFGLRVGRRCLHHGLLPRFDPHRIAFGPPLIITEADIDQMVGILERSVVEAMQGL